MFSFTCKKKKEQAEQKQTHKYRDQSHGCQRREGRKAYEIDESDKEVQTSNYKIGKTWGWEVLH